MCGVYSVCFNTGAYQFFYLVFKDMYISAYLGFWDLLFSENGLRVGYILGVFFLVFLEISFECGLVNDHSCCVSLKHECM